MAVSDGAGLALRCHGKLRRALGTGTCPRLRAAQVRPRRFNWNHKLFCIVCNLWRPTDHDCTFDEVLEQQEGQLPDSTTSTSILKENSHSKMFHTFVKMWFDLIIYLSVWVFISWLYILVGVVGFVVL